MSREIILRIVAADVRRRNFSRAWLCGPPPHVGGYGPMAVLTRVLSFGIALLPGLVAGCSRAPTFDIVGSFFPAWLVCFIAGIFLASFAHWLLSRLKIVLLVPILVYPSLAALFTFMLWLIFFG